MSSTPPRFVRISNENGHFTVPAAVAERAGSDWRELKSDAVDGKGDPLPSKPREDTLAATPTTDPETASGDTTEESA